MHETTVSFDKDTSYSDVIEQLERKMGLIKRTTGTMMIKPKSPPMRVFTHAEEKVLREYFADEFKWSDIDADGNILLYPKNDNKKITNTFVTLDDVKKEIANKKKRT